MHTWNKINELEQNMSTVNDIKTWQVAMDEYEERFGRSTATGPLFFAKEEIRALREHAEKQEKARDRLIVGLKRLIERFSMEYRVPASGTIPHEIHIAVDALNAAQGTSLVYKDGRLQEAANA
jgi:hypothetical protein